MLKFFIILFIYALSLIAKDVSLVLPWKHQFQFAGYYMAKEKGFYKDVGLHVDIKEYDLKRNNTEDVTSGKYEFGVGHSSVILEKFTTYDNVVLLNAIHQSSPFILLSIKYKNLEDIVGKTVMMSNDQTTTASINAMLHFKNLILDSYKVIDTSFNPIDLIKGNADFMSSYISNEPYTLSQKGVKYFILDPKDYGYDFYSDILFTSKEMLKENQHDVDNFRDASLKGWQYAYEHVDETIDVILNYYNTQSRTKDALLYEAESLKKLAFVKDVNFGTINPMRVREIMTTYRLLGLLKKNFKINYDELLYTSPERFKFIIKSEEKTEYFQFINNIYFKFMFLTLFIIIFISILFKIRLEKLLKEQKIELSLNNQIFNKNICSSITDTKGRIISVSEAFCKCTGYTEKELLSRSHNILRGDETKDEVYHDLWLNISSGHQWRGNLKNRKKDGSEYWVQLIISPIYDNKGLISSYESIVNDVTLEKVLEDFNEKLELEVKRKTAKLEKLAVTDKLTGIYNRVKLDDDLEHNFKHFQDFGENYSVIIIDIDKFKDVNDTYGHQVGDTILQEVVKQIHSSIRSTDTLGRWGGEEFMVICPNSGIETTYNLAQKIRKSIQMYSFSRVGNMSVSSGVCDIKSVNNLDKMISCADAALYDAKHTGRNRVCKYKEEKQ